jgi:cytochrome c-type biogenesis protein CcmH
VALVVTTPLAADPLQFESAEQEARFTELTAELRCTVCQNQSLADSDAPLAQDLRNEIHLMMQQGDSDEDIKRFLVDRYGDFVLYRPPVRGATLLLWIAPLLLLTTGAVVMAITIHRRRVMLAEEALGAALEDGNPNGRGDAAPGDRTAVPPGRTGAREP